MSDERQVIRVWRRYKGWAFFRDPYHFFDREPLHGLWTSRQATEVLYFHFNDRLGHQKMVLLDQTDLYTWNMNRNCCGISYIP
jgi:hypothetical protein